MRALAHSGAALAALVGAPIAAGALALRPSWRRGSFERLGGVRAEPGAVWVHGASVGEALAAIPLLDGLLARGHRVAVSTTTLAGRDTLRRLRPDLRCGLAPLDHPWVVERSLAIAQPNALVLLEAELWPSWIAAASRRGVPLALLSGRISDRSYARYRRVRPLVRRTLQRFDSIGARSERDAERFRALGAEATVVTTSGDLKLDGDAVGGEASPELVRWFAGAAVFVAGSTHPGEESAALLALEAAEAAGQGAALVLAPRRVERADEVERLAHAHGRRVLRRSALAGAAARGAGPAKSGDVLLLDTLGELRGLWALATAAFVGGTLARVGGHNLLEPVAAGRPVLFGPHTDDVEHAVELLEGTGAARSVADAAALGRALVALLADPTAAAASGRRGREAIERRRGSSARSIALLERLIRERWARA